MTSIKGELHPLPLRGAAFIIPSEAADSAVAEVILPVQTHSSNVAIADGTTADFPDTDALICRRKGVSVGVRTADCVPVLLRADDIGAVAAVHAGWRGTLDGILTRTLERLRAMGADISRLHAAFGPSICQACYEVSPELAERFIDAGFGDCVSTPSGGRPHIDLQGVNVRRLLDAGVPEGNIVVSPLCTAHTASPLLPSWRRDNGTQLRLVSFITL